VIAMLDKEGEQIESLGFQLNKLGAASQLAAFDVEPVLAKRQNHAPSSRPTFCPDHKPAVRKKKGGGKAFSARSGYRDAGSEETR
jgi:hypothetical protein